MAFVYDPNNRANLNTELKAKYGGFFTGVVISHTPENLTAAIHIAFRTEGWEHKLAADYLEVIDEVCRSLLGVSQRTLNQLGIKFDIHNHQGYKLFSCTLDSMTRHLLLNGQDDPLLKEPSFTHYSYVTEPESTYKVTLAAGTPITWKAGDEVYYTHTFTTK